MTDDLDEVLLAAGDADPGQRLRFEAFGSALLQAPLAERAAELYLQHYGARDLVALIYGQPLSWVLAYLENA